MAILLVLQGPDNGKQFLLETEETVAGRQKDAVAIYLAGSEVSRRHARFHCRDDGYWVEDLDSRNGTYVNGRKIPASSPVLLAEHDEIQIGPHRLSLRLAAEPEPNFVVREKITASSFNQSVYGQDPAQKLQVVLELAQHLARTLDLEPLLDRLLEDLLRLFPQADHALAVLCEGEHLVVKAQRARHAADATTYPFSRTIIRRALEESAGLLTDDAQADQRFQASASISSLNLHSLLCVPLLAQDGKPLGALQVDRYRMGQPFAKEDLELLTTIGLQVSVMLEYAALHAEKMRQARLLQEVALARQIQQSSLPEGLEGQPAADFEILGRVFPALEVAGDLYDFLPLPQQRLAFFIGDVSGKGMPAALFLVAVRTLCRHLVKTVDNPVGVLKLLNDALAANNSSCQFVTLIHGVYDGASGEIVMASGGHPPPLLHHADGSVEEVAMETGRLLGIDEGDLGLHEVRLVLQPGQTLVFYTDGLIEARIPERKLLFGLERTIELVQGFDNSLTLAACADRARKAVHLFTSSRDLQDDLTLLLLRRKI